MHRQISSGHLVERVVTWLRLPLAALLMTMSLLPTNAPVVAADGWTSLSSGTTRDLRAVAAVGSSTAWVVGSGGTILKTTDAGARWTAQSSGTTEDLLGIAALDGQTAWVVGAGSTILKTSNGGTDWARQAAYPGAYLVGVTATDPDHAWAVEGGSGTILATTDGGATWTTQYEYGYPLTAIVAADAEAAWAVGQSGAVLSTTDAGATWNPGWCNDCHFLSAVAAIGRDALWTVGRAGIIAQSTDGGFGWQVQASGVQDDLTAIAAADADTAYALGISGTILKTTDGGTRWTAQASGGPALRGVATAGPGLAYAVGDAGVILQTGAAPLQPSVPATPAPTAVAPSVPASAPPPGKWTGTVTIVQNFTWQGSASAGQERYAGNASAQLTTKINLRDSVATAESTFSGSTSYTTNGTGSPCSYEITRTESGNASLSTPLEVSISLPTADRLALNIVVVPDPAGSLDVQEVSRNYGGESCFTEVDRRQYAFGSNNTSLEGFYRELEFQLEHDTFQTHYALALASGGPPAYAAAESTSSNVPMSRPVGMPNITTPGQETMTITWDLRASPAN